MNLTQLDLLGMAYRRLSKRQQNIVRMRFEDRMTYQEIGDEIDTSKMQVQRICEKSLKKIKINVTNQG